MSLLLLRTNFEATPPPILVDNGLAVLENEKIERHIMKNVPGGHNLFVQDKEVATLIENLYSVSEQLPSAQSTYFHKDQVERFNGFLHSPPPQFSKLLIEI